jgi:hypothetical protein
MQFNLQIKSDNDAMQTGADIARALREVADKLDYNVTPPHGEYANIKDLNGNNVGGWRVK